MTTSFIVFKEEFQEIYSIQSKSKLSHLAYTLDQGGGLFKK